jgi:hypothetical protein
MILNGDGEREIGPALGMCPGTFGKLSGGKDKKLTTIVKRARSEFKKERKRKVDAKWRKWERLHRKPIRVSDEKRAEMMSKTNNHCYLCGKSAEKNKRRLAVDHCHKNGVIRGLLCTECNLLLGHVEKALRNNVTTTNIQNYLDNRGGIIAKPVARRARSARKESA